MPLPPKSLYRRPSSLRGTPPRYQVFDRTKNPPRTVGTVYVDPDRRSVVIEVYDDGLREILKREEPFRSRDFDWILDVDVDAPHDTRAAIIRVNPAAGPTDHPGGESLALEDAVEGLSNVEGYRVVRTSDPV